MKNICGIHTEGNLFLGEIEGLILASRPIITLEKSISTADHCESASELICGGAAFKNGGAWRRRQVRCDGSPSAMGRDRGCGI